MFKEFKISLSYYKIFNKNFQGIEICITYLIKIKNILELGVLNLYILYTNFKYIKEAVV